MGEPTESVVTAIIIAAEGGGADKASFSVAGVESSCRLDVQ